MSNAYNDLGAALFGDDAFSSDRVVLLEHCRKFVDAAVVCVWKRMRNSVDRHSTKANLLKNKVDEEWDGMCFGVPRHRLPSRVFTI